MHEVLEKESQRWFPQGIKNFQEVQVTTKHMEEKTLVCSVWSKTGATRFATPHPPSLYVHQHNSHTWCSGRENDRKMSAFSFQMNIL